MGRATLVVVPPPTLRAWLDGVISSHRRVEAAVDGVTDEVVRRPSLLPGWTVGHLMTHIARNADSQIRMLRGAQAGDVVDQYPGGVDGRAAAIEDGSARSAAELRADIAETDAELERAYAETSDEVWASGLGRMIVGGPQTVAELVFRRWREVEVHGVDLGLPPLDWDSLSPSYVDVEWERALATMPARMDPAHTLVLVPDDRPSRAFGSGAEHVIVRGTPGRILGWLLRGTGDPTWPTLAPWG